MKKSLLSIFAMATMLLATGCSQDDELVNGGENGELVEVSFNLKSSEGAQSRAISDGKKAKELFYGAFDQNGNVIPTQHGKTTMEDPVAGTTVTFKLVKGQTYDFVFWAQTPDNKYYNVNPENLTEISVNYNTDANDENRDAFFGKELGYTVEGRFTKTVKLTRPFGQLNVGTTIEDYNTATTLLSGKKVNKSKLVVKNLPNTLNLLTGELGESVTAEAVFNLAALPTDADNDYEILAVDINKDKEIAENEKYVHLSMNYLLAAEEESAIHEVDITFANGDTDADIINTINVPNAPIQRNYRTNILGQILTTEGDFIINVEPAYVDDHNYFLSEYTVASTAELLEVLKTLNAEDYTGPTNVTINLAADVEWETGAGHGTTPLLAATSKVKELVIDGHGNTIIPTGKGVGSIRHAASDGKLFFRNVKFTDESASYAEGSWEFSYLEFAGVLDFSNCQFGSGIQLDSDNGQAPTLNATFTDCVFQTEETSIYAVWVSHGSTVFNECTFTGTRGLKIHEDYGSDITDVMVNNCMFKDITVKPGIVLGTIGVGENGQYVASGGATYTGVPAIITVKNSTFINTAIGHHVTDNKGREYGIDYILETDTKISDLGEQLIVEGNSVEKDNILVIASAEGLRQFAESVNSGEKYTNKTVELGANIDLKNVEWTPIGNTRTNYFGGTFDGKGYTISNLAVNTDELAGLFGHLGNTSGSVPVAVVKNVELEGVKITSSHYAGAVAGQMACATIENCSVNNAEIVLAVMNNGNGDKAGGIVGHQSDCSTDKIQNCKVSNTTIQAYRDLGGIAGYITNATISGNEIENVTLIVDQANNYKNYSTQGEHDANHIIGEKASGAKDSNNTGTATIKYIDATGLSQDAEGNYLIYTAADMLTFADAVNNGVTEIKGGKIKLMENIDLAGIDWKPIGQTGTTYGAVAYFQGTFDGNGKTISNLKVTHWEAGNDQGESYATGLFGFLDCGQSGAIKNLTVDGAVVKGHHWCGVIAGYTSGTVENCIVKNATVECTHKNSGACGDKAGVITGYINGTQGTVKNCQAIDSTVKAGRDGGQVVGASKKSQVSDCTAANVLVSATGDCDDDGAGQNINNTVIGREL